MKTVGVVLSICCCLSSVSGRLLETMTALPAERPVSSGAAVAPTLPIRVGVPFDIDIGTVDTIGGTTYDWQFNGPVWRMIVDSRRHGIQHGIHAVWIYATDTLSSFWDRNMRYNFYDTWAGDWNWLDSDFMCAGVNVFAWRSGYGNIDVDTSGVAVISLHHATGSGFAPVVARDADIGCGIFDYSYGEPTVDGYGWPCIGVNMNGDYQSAMIDYATYENLYWGRVTGQVWDPAVYMASPLFLDHNIATSKVPGSNKVCITWVEAPASGYGQQPGFYCESQDAGDNWGSPVDIGFPPAFHPGSETLPSFHSTALFPFYDSDDRLNIVANVSPYVRDTNWILPGQIWHWCAANPDTWSLIRVASPESLNAAVGYNAMICCRPSLGQDDYGDLFVTWEEFDGVNVEPMTGLLRADVWTAGSTDGGVTWSTAMRLTTPGTASCRFPSICDRLWPGDSLAVLYEVDQCAGFFVMGDGPVTFNPMVVQKVPADSIIQRGPYYGRLKEPNGGESLYTGGSFAIDWVVAGEAFDHGVLSLSTDGGSTFPTVLADSIPPAQTTYLWDPIPQLCCSLCRVRFTAVDSLDDTVFSDGSYRNFAIDSVFVGVSDNRLEPGTAAKPVPTIIHGVLFLPRDMTGAGHDPNAGHLGSCPKPILLDISGRKVMDLRPGENDVRHLAPGVYFVRDEGQGTKDAGRTRKVVITR